jgi:hypothetical protein
MFMQIIEQEHPVFFFKKKRKKRKRARVSVGVVNQSDRKKAAFPLRGAG